MNIDAFSSIEDMIAALSASELAKARAPVASLVEDTVRGLARQGATIVAFTPLDMAAISVPIGLVAPGLAVGIQIAVRQGDDALALRIGRAVERLGWTFTRPAS